MNRMKKGNLITASICCGVGLALVGTGIYYLTTGSRLTGGVIIGLGLAICAMFVVTLVMMRKFDRLKADADAKYEEERARQYAAVKEMVERLRAADGNISQEEVAKIIAEAREKALSDAPFPEETEETDGGETAEERERAGETAPAEAADPPAGSGEEKDSRPEE